MKVLTWAPVWLVRVPLVPLIASAGVARSVVHVVARAHAATLVLWREDLFAVARNRPIQDHPAVTGRHQRVFQWHLPAITGASEDLLVLVEEEDGTAGVGLLAGDIPRRPWLVERQVELLRAIHLHPGRAAGTDLGAWPVEDGTGAYAARGSSAARGRGCPVTTTRRAREVSDEPVVAAGGDEYVALGEGEGRGLQARRTRNDSGDLRLRPPAAVVAHLFGGPCSYGDGGFRHRHLVDFVDMLADPEHGLVVWPACYHEPGDIGCAAPFAEGKGDILARQVHLRRW